MTQQVLRPAADRLDFVSLQVRDLEKTRSFYTDVLGFSVVPQERPDALVFRTSVGASFAVRKPLVDLNAVQRLGWGVGLWFGAQEIDSLHERVRDCGATVLRPPADGPFGRMFVVEDPDGYQLTLHANA